MSDSASFTQLHQGGARFKMAAATCQQTVIVVGLVEYSSKTHTTVIKLHGFNKQDIKECIWSNFSKLNSKSFWYLSLAFPEFC